MWIIGPILLIILTAFRYIFPIDKSRDSKYYSIDQLRSEFIKIDLLSLLIFFVSIGCWTSVFYYLLNAISDSNSYIDQFEIVIISNPGFWLFCSIILGLSFGCLSVILFLKLSLKDRISRFLIYYNLKYKFNAFLLFKILFVSLSLGGYVLVFFGFKSHVLVNKDKMIIQGLFSLKEKEYNLDMIESIKYIDKIQLKDGNINRDSRYKIEFNDKSFWYSSGVVGKDFDCINYLTDITRLKIDSIDME